MPEPMTPPANVLAALERLRDCTHHRPACAATGLNAGQMLALVEDRPIPPASPCTCGLDADLALLAAAADAGARAREQDKKPLAEAIFWLLRSYQSGHRQGWEPGPSTKETMDGLFTWLCGEGFDPNEDSTPQFMPQILAALLAPAEGRRDGTKETTHG